MSATMFYESPNLTGGLSQIAYGAVLV